MGMGAINDDVIFRKRRKFFTEFCLCARMQIRARFIKQVDGIHVVHASDFRVKLQLHHEIKEPIKTLASILNAEVTIVSGNVFLYEKI